MNVVVKRGIRFFTDKEGPCSLNDNAQENTVALAEQSGLGREVGAAFYQRLSNIDDLWGDHKLIEDIDPTYSAGHTLKVILAFYKAMGATSEWLYDFAQKSLRVVPHIDEVLTNLDRKYGAWMISTSYHFFVQAFCDRVGFDFSKARCTFVNKFDEIPISQSQTKLLRDFMTEVAEMPVIKYDETGLVIPEHQAFYNRFTKFIWGTVLNMKVGELLKTVHPVGQDQKLQEMMQICKELGIPLERVMFAGDSQTDVECVKHVKEKGLSLLFNGKGRVCQDAHIMYIGQDARATEEVADVFAKDGRDGAIAYCTPSRETAGGTLYAVTPDNVEELEAMSVEMRKQFRGVDIGELT